MTKIAFFIFPELTLLDLVGPMQVLSLIPDAKLSFISKDLSAVAGEGGLSVLPTATFDHGTDYDVLCVPGGVNGTLRAIEDDAGLRWLRETGLKATWVTSVCTGSLLLGAAGLLKGFRATSHWNWTEELARFGAIPESGRVIWDQNRVTGGGVTAGIDFGLSLAAKLCGEERAKQIQLMLEYDPAPPFDFGSPDKVPAEFLQAYRQRSAPLLASRRAALDRAATRLGP